MSLPSEDLNMNTSSLGFTNYHNDFNSILQSAGAKKEINKIVKKSVKENIAKSRAALRDSKKKLNEFVVKLKEGKIGKIIKGIKIFAIFCLIVVMLYILYIVIFRGYPRSVGSLISFSFYRIEKPDDFMKEGGYFLKHFNYLVEKSGSCMSPHEMYSLIYDKSSNLLPKLELLMKHKETYYGKYRYDDQFYNMMKEYYFFYNAVQQNDVLENAFMNGDINQPIKLEVVLENGSKTDKVKSFYEQYAIYKTYTKEMSDKDGKGKKLGLDMLMYNANKADKLNNYAAYRGISNVHALLACKKLTKPCEEADRSITADVACIRGTLQRELIAPYLLYPEDDTVRQKVITELSKYQDMIVSDTIYTLKADELNDFTWIIIEYLSSAGTTSQYTNFISKLPRNVEKNANFRYYVNLPGEKKTLAEKRIFDTQDKPVLEYLRKRPIFSHIYLSTVPNKQELYSKIMFSYRLMSSCNAQLSQQQNEKSVSTFIKSYNPEMQLANLRTNMIAFKQFVLSIEYLYLFLFVYREEITDIYEGIMSSNEKFFNKLFTPFLIDYGKNRMLARFKITFGPGFNTSLKKFKVWYKGLGDILNSTIRHTFQAFFVSKKIEKPKETEVTDPNDNNAEVENPS